MRRALDAYYSPSDVGEELLKHYPWLLELGNKVQEPCAGDGSLVRCLPRARLSDIDPALGHPTRDACHATYFGARAFVTNPPFNQAFEILLNLARQNSYFVALFLRLSFLEPTYQRGDYLEKNPPNHIIVMPRISFTGDGKTDSVTTAWMVWGSAAKKTVDIVSKGSTR